MQGSPVTEFVRKECQTQLSKLMNGLDVTLDFNANKHTDGRDLWVGSISFELSPGCLWRLSIRFSTRDARLLTAHAAGINPKIITIPIIHSCIGETLNTIAGPIKQAASTAVNAESPIKFRPMLPQIKPTYDLGVCKNVIGLASDRFNANFVGGRLEFECLWSELFPAYLVDHREQEFGEMEFL